MLSAPNRSFGAGVDKSIEANVVLVWVALRRFDAAQLTGVVAEPAQQAGRQGPLRSSDDSEDIPVYAGCERLNSNRR